MVDGFLRHKEELKKGKPIALLIDSPGGHAKCTFQIANLVRQRCGSFTAVVPRYAKSAATLLSLGAQKILMSANAELGPLDVQLLDPDREDRVSALDEVKALESVFRAAFEEVDRAMFLLCGRTRKKVESLLPTTLKFVSDMMRPLLEKIDTVHHNQVSRLLRVAEEYAIRLLQPLYNEGQAREIATALIEKYPDHGFFIDANEAKKLGLHVSVPHGEVEATMEALAQMLMGGPRFTAVGRLVEFKGGSKG
jgi:ATP-dependent protease ClpP protease subunit